MTDTTAYSWIVTPQGSTSMTVDGQALTGVFTSLHWRLRAVRTITQPDPAPPLVYSGEVFGEYRLAPPNPESFTARDAVTDEMKIGWLTAGLGADEITKQKARVDAQIAVLIVPVAFTDPVITAPA
ncbi:MAG: hypothetical protein ISS15_05305 [Alphaproteobacteria bacterium]|nr:hypothetical protein [Alphaproteobacteria bacterium]MBL6939463.1 hypothetical protein [Alphaproteobacteria bacterium]MBL7097056.1 hypothetical protein [Alphaproteobacteria bacterium]